LRSRNDGGFAALREARRPVVASAKPRRLCQFWQANRQKNPTLSTKQKIRRGEISKMNQGAVFLAGRVPALLEQASGLSLQVSTSVVIC